MPETDDVTVERARDVHSYANVDEVRVTHVELDLTVLFEERQLRAAAMLSFERVGDDVDVLVLDTRDLHITAVESWSALGGFDPATYAVGMADRVLGAPLTITLPPDATRVRVTYETSPDASGLQWLSPEQTAGGEYPLCLPSLKPFMRAAGFLCRIALVYGSHMVLVLIHPRVFAR